MPSRSLHPIPISECSISRCNPWDRRLTFSDTHDASFQFRVDRLYSDPLQTENRNTAILIVSKNLHKEPYNKLLSNI